MSILTDIFDEIACRVVPFKSSLNTSFRPDYHFVPPRNWINDPNGLIQFGDYYHLFYQYNPATPFGPVMNNIHWGHARSKDLINWEHLPIALCPDQAYDRCGVWSGTVVKNGDTATAFYTGIPNRLCNPQLQCSADSSDCINWTKNNRNPLIKKAPQGVFPMSFRDPYVFRYGDLWLMILGASFKGKGAAMLYSSTNLIDWEYRHPLLIGDGKKQGGIWECPNFVQIGNKWVLAVSLISGETKYFTGDFEDLVFKPESYNTLDYGSCFYAPQIFKDNSGRAIMFGWLKENRRYGFRDGWQGAMSLPRVISQNTNGNICFHPSEETQLLRDKHYDVSIFDCLSSKVIKSDKLEIILDVESIGHDPCGIDIIHCGSKQFSTKIYLSPSEKQFVIDRSKSGGQKGIDSKPVKAHTGMLDRCRFHIFIDKSVMEIFLNDNICITTRIYPQSESTQLILVKGKNTQIRSIDIWSLKSTNT
ncbi:MAG TPA: glycoside hydrolase family 32 protein [bacterium]|nr:glycoside hydrolase family 32 protein [bacterium]